MAIFDTGSGGTSPDDGSAATPANSGNICGTCGGRSYAHQLEHQKLCRAGVWARFVLGRGPGAPGGVDTGADAALRVSCFDDCVSRVRSLRVTCSRTLSFSMPRLQPSREARSETSLPLTH